MRVFMDHSWPGNVRKLENPIEHAFVLCNRDQIEISDLPIKIRQPGDECWTEAIAGAAAKKVRIGKDLSKEALMKLLETSHWNKAEVTRRLGVSRTAVWKYMKKWDIPLKNTGKTKVSQV
jgi:transcriptional regulator of acetoin/glycerol metabolism